MEDIFVARVMTTDVHTVSPDTLVEDAAGVMMDSGIGSLVVTDEDDQVEGILTTTDFVHIVAHSKPKAETTVSRYMTEDVFTTTAQVPIQEVADLMVENGFRHVPVVDEDDTLIGMISSTDLAGYISTVRKPSPA